MQVDNHIDLSYDSFRNTVFCSIPASETGHVLNNISLELANFY